MIRLDFRSLFWQGTPLFLWASTFSATHAALGAYSPGHVVVLRLGTASLILAGFAWRVRMRRPRRQDLPGIILASLLGNSVNTAMLNYGQVTVAPGVASLLVNSSPIFTALFAAILLGERLGAKGWIGIVTSFCGVALITAGEGKGFSLNPGAALILASAVSFGAYTIVQKQLLREYSGLELGAYIMWTGSAFTLVFAPGLLDEIRSAPLDATVAAVYMGVLPSALANVMWGYVLARKQASNVASRFYLVPPIAIGIAWFWPGNVPSILSLIGGAVVLAGVLLVDSRSRAPSRPRPSDPRAAGSSRHEPGLGAPSAGPVPRTGGVRDLRGMSQGSALPAPAPSPRGPAPASGMIAGNLLLNRGFPKSVVRDERSPTLVMMAGPPATGKSHLVQLLMERIPFQVVETDEIRRQIAHPPVYTATENRRVFYVAHRRIGQLLRRGKNVVFDATNIHESGRRTVARMAESAGARLLIVRTVAPDHVVAERLRRRRTGLEPADRSEAGWDVYARMKAEFEEIKRPHLVVDTAGDLAPALEAIVRFVKDEDKGSANP